MTMDEALKSALQINVQLLRRVAALEIVLAALIRSQPDSIRRTTIDEAQELMAVVVGNMGLEAEIIQTLTEDLIASRILGRPQSP